MVRGNSCPISLGECRETINLMRRKYVYERIHATIIYKLESKGYKLDKVFSRMVIDLTSEPEIPALADDISLLPFDMNRDANSLTNANRLYESVGMKAAFQNACYRKETISKVNRYQLYTVCLNPENLRYKKTAT